MNLALMLTGLAALRNAFVRRDEQGNPEIGLSVNELDFLFPSMYLGGLIVEEK